VHAPDSKFCKEGLMMVNWPKRVFKIKNKIIHIVVFEPMNYFVAFSSRPYFALQNSHGHAKEFLRNYLTIWARALKNVRQLCPSVFAFGNAGL
jgi:hypothetical protein